MNIGYKESAHAKLQKLESEPVNVEFVGKDGSARTESQNENNTVFAKVAPGNDEYMDRDATDKDIEEGNYTKVSKMVFDEVDPS